MIRTEKYYMKTHEENGALNSMMTTQDSTNHATGLWQIRVRYTQVGIDVENPGKGPPMFSRLDAQSSAWKHSADEDTIIPPATRLRGRYDQLPKGGGTRVGDTSEVGTTPTNPPSGAGSFSQEVRLLLRLLVSLLWLVL